jgi:hypothetical protein
VNDAMRTLRAELASAAREAKRNGSRVDPRQEARKGAREAGVDQRIALREAEALLAVFRQELRTDLRSQTARGALPADIVPLLRGELDRVRRTVAEALSRR